MTGDDHARLGDDAERLVTWDGNRAFMRLEPVAGTGLHRCAALAIDVAGGRFLCTVYERRPQVCRDLAQGSGACRGELHAKADRPRRALAVLGPERPQRTTSNESMVGSAPDALKP